jgi:hypothetical protein
MRLPGNRKRWAMGCALCGMVLMGVDLLVTRNFFIHVAELMVPSLICFALALFIDRDPPAPDGDKHHG